MTCEEASYWQVSTWRHLYFVTMSGISSAHKCTLGQRWQSQHNWLDTRCFQDIYQAIMGLRKYSNLFEFTRNSPFGQRCCVRASQTLSVTMVTAGATFNCALLRGIMYFVLLWGGGGGGFQ